MFKIYFCESGAEKHILFPKVLFEAHAHHYSINTVDVFEVHLKGWIFGIDAFAVHRVRVGCLLLLPL